MGELSRVKKRIGDVDVDVGSRESALEALSGQYVSSSLKPKDAPDRAAQGRYTPHPTGIYLFDMPVDPVTGISSLDSVRASELGYQKVDVIQNHALHERPISPSEFMEIVDDFDFTIFDDDRIYDGLVHLSRYRDLVQSMQPRSVEDLAIILALIRPAKKHLIGRSMDEIRREIWKKADGYYFKKSHAIAYALLTMYDAYAKSMEHRLKDRS